MHQQENWSKHEIPKYNVSLPVQWTVGSDDAVKIINKICIICGYWIE